MVGNIKTIFAAISLSAIGLCALAAPAHAGTLSWSGDVDDTATIAISGRNIRTTSNAGGIRNERRNLRGELPRDDVRVRLDWGDGRGDVRIIQQPSSRNNYTTLIRIVDKEKGREHYDFTLNWDERYDTGRDNRDHDRYDQGRDNRDRDNRDNRDRDKRDRGNRDRDKRDRDNRDKDKRDRDSRDRDSRDQDQNGDRDRRDDNARDRWNRSR